MSDEQADPYIRLRPAGPTADEDVCRCPSGTEVTLRDGMTDNPLVCLTCNGEVPPERLGFSGELADEISDWLSVYDSLYRLWLDSGEYEQWAAARLSDADGAVNTRGREIVARLNEIVPAYYWWSVDTDASEPLAACPVCSGPLRQFADRDFQVCSACRILF